MIRKLSPTGYESTRRKLTRLQQRLTALQQRGDISPALKGEAVRSYESVIRDFLREIKLYEASTPSPTEVDQKSPTHT